MNFRHAQNIEDLRAIARSRLPKIARDFLAQHAPEMSLAAMHISEGKVITHVK